MTILYSPATGGFYPLDLLPDYVAAGTWPVDGVEISADRHADLLAQLATGRLIVPGADGFPVAVDPPPPDRRPAIAARLTEIDAASARPLRAIATETATAADHARLAALETEAAALRAELLSLPSPDTDTGA